MNLDFGTIAIKLENKLPRMSGFILSILFNFFIPFNKQFGSKIAHWTLSRCEVEVKVRRRLTNHLKSLHAGAIATLGEFTAGMTILKNFNVQEYRLILKELNTEYSAQIRQKACASCDFGESEVLKIKEALNQNGEATIMLDTKILREDQKHAATVKTVWQLKSWKSVRQSK